MWESMEGLSLGAVLSQWLGPPPETQPDVEHSAEEASTQQDLNKLRRPDGRSCQLNRAWRDTAEYERQKGELEKNEVPGMLRESTRSQEEGSQSVGRNQPKATEPEQVQRPVSR